MFLGADPNMQVNINFDLATTTEYSSIAKSKQLLTRGKQALIDIDHYQGCGKHIKEALSNCNDETIQRKTFTIVSPNISKIQEFYVLCEEIGTFTVCLSG